MIQDQDTDSTEEHGLTRTRGISFKFLARDISSIRPSATDAYTRINSGDARWPARGCARVGPSRPDMRAPSEHAGVRISDRDDPLMPAIGRHGPAACVLSVSIRARPAGPGFYFHPCFALRSSAWVSVRSRQQRLIQKANQRHHRPEGVEQCRVELGRGRKGGRELTASEEVFVFQVFRRGIVRGISPGQPCQSIAIQRAEHPPELDAPDQAVDLGVGL